MNKTASCVALATLVGLSALTGCATRAVIVARPGPPPPAVVIAAPGPRAVWVPGHWVWRPYWGRYVWIRGHWR